MRIIICIFVTSFAPFILLSQSIAGFDWIISKNEVISSQNSYVLYDQNLSPNSIDLSSIVISFQSNNSFSGIRVDGSTHNGTYQISGNSIVIDGESGTLTFVSENEFIVSKSILLPNLDALAYDIPAISNLHFVKLSPLPIELISFSGSASGKFNLIDWEVNERSVRKYSLFRKKDQEGGFELLGELPSRGDGDKNKYQFTDDHPYPTSYYRLVSHDIDGQLSYSQIIAVKNNHRSFYINKIYPIPARDYLKFEAFSSGARELTINLYNISGIHQQVSHFRKEEGLNELSIDISGLSSGYYYVEIIDGSQKIGLFGLPKY